MFWKRTKHEIDKYNPEYIILDALFVYLCKNISTFVYLCVFMCFLVFTLFNIVFVNNLTIALIFACFAYTFQSWYLSYAKAWVSGRESMGFRLWKQGFHDVKPMLSDRNLMPFSTTSQYCIFMHKLLSYLNGLRIDWWCSFLGVGEGIKKASSLWGRFYKSV